MEKDEKYIRHCLELAKLGIGKVSPNPLVGSIVLDKNDNIVGKGFHEKYGESHAEVNALNEADERAIDGTLYVNLEPCSHFGKTPPCAERIIESGIKRIVVGIIDPNSLVAGQGINKIKEAGIEVTVGILEQECKKLNEIFIKFITQKKPFIAIKTASTIDGKIATKTKSSKWITSNPSREEVQVLRNKYDAILTGSGTVLADNPSLTCRIENGKNPVRIIIDSKLKTSPDSQVYHNDDTRVIIAASSFVNEDRIRLYPKNVEILRCPIVFNNKIDLEYLINKLYHEKIASILVEAGGYLNGTLIKNNLVDKFYFFIAPKILGDRDAFSFVEGFDIQDINNSLNLRFDEIKFLPPDVMIEAYFKIKQ